MRIRDAQPKDHQPRVVLVGRVNVGKSTLFNLFVGEQKAVVAPVPGTTRDANRGIGTWREHEFQLVDTGGFVVKPATDIEQAVARNVSTLLKEADLILFIVDIQEGLHPDDRLFLSHIRSIAKKPLLLVGNKADSPRHALRAHDAAWLKLGMGEPFPVSAVSGRGSGDLADRICELLGAVRPSLESTTEHESISVALIGRPNVGKSSILNMILGEERVITSPTPHTTREPQDTRIRHGQQELVLIDTVGIRRTSKVKHRIEREGVQKSIRRIEHADVACLVLDSTVTPSKQERRLAEVCVTSGVGIVIVLNKWDLVEGKTTRSIQAFEQLIRSYFPFIPWVPFISVSAVTGQRVGRILDSVCAVALARGQQIPHDQLQEFLAKALSRQRPAIIRGTRRPVIYELVQTRTKPPTFCITVNDPKSITYQYLKYLEHRLREAYNFSGVPIRIATSVMHRKKKKKEGRV